jgi:hypothetical protein
MARATSSLPVPDGPVTRVGTSFHPRVERAAVAPAVAREDRLPDRRAQAARGRRLAEDVRVDVMERAPDLVVAREDVGCLRPEGARAPPDVEVVAEILAHPLEERPDAG